MPAKTYITYSVVFIAALITPIVLSASQPIITQNTIMYPEQNYTQISQTPVALAQKCGPIFGVQDIDGLIQKIPSGHTKPIPSSPGLIPTFGYINSTPLTKEEITYYPENTPHIDEQTILSTMWSNDIITIWYDPEQIKEEEKDLLVELGEKNIGELLILPWMGYEDSEHMPIKRSIALATIGYTQSCEGLNINVLNDFRTYTLLNRSYTLGETLPVAQLNAEKKLDMIVPD